MVDCSHGNSRKDPSRQPEVATTAVQHDAVRALMIESHLVGGRQDLGGPLTYGKSVTDACLGFDETTRLLRRLAETV